MYPPHLPLDHLVHPFFKTKMLSKVTFQSQQKSRNSEWMPTSTNPVANKTFARLLAKIRASFTNAIEFRTALNDLLMEASIEPDYPFAVRKRLCWNLVKERLLLARAAIEDPRSGKPTVSAASLILSEPQICRMINYQQRLNSLVLQMKPLREGDRDKLKMSDAFSQLCSAINQYKETEIIAKRVIPGSNNWRLHMEQVLQPEKFKLPLLMTDPHAIPPVHVKPNYELRNSNTYAENHRQYEQRTYVHQPYGRPVHAPQATGGVKTAERPLSKRGRE